MHGAPFTWPRPDQDRAFIEYGGIVRPGPTLGDYRGDKNPYNPFEHPNLPNALAKVHTEQDVLEFVGKYGLLGFSFTESNATPKPLREGYALHPVILDNMADNCLLRRAEYPPGDPVEWFLAHARAIDFALRLLDALEYPGDDMLLKVLKSFRQDWKHPPQVSFPADYIHGFGALSSPGGGIIGIYPVAVGKHYNIGTPPFVSEVGWDHRGRPHSTRVHANNLLTYMVNENTTGVTRSLVSRNGGVFVRWGAQSLVQVIWWHVGEKAAMVTRNRNNLDDDKDAKTIRECEECGTPFFVTDKRQRFCPPDPWSSASRCAERNRKRRLRQRKRRQQKEGS